MGIKIFFKHLFRSIRMRPVQPFILTFIIMFAVAVCILTSSILDYNLEELNGKHKAQNGNANVVITPNSDSEVRFLDPDKAQNYLNENYSGSYVCGAYAIPFYYGENKDFTYGVITDMQSAANVFELPSTLPSTRHDKRKTACISKDFAEAHGLEVNSELNFTILGTKCRFTVMSISSLPIMGQYDVMIDAVAAMNILQGGSILEGIFMPYGKLFVYANCDDVSQTIDDLSIIYKDASVSGVGDATKSIDRSIDDTLKVFMLITAVLTILTLYCCFSILTAQRADENILFYNVGTKAYMLDLLSVAELFVYWTVGTIAGIALSYPLSKMMIDISGMRYVEPGLDVDKVALISAIMLIATEFSNIFHIAETEIKKHFAKRKKIADKSDDKMSYVILGIIVLAIVFSVGSIFFAVEYRNREYPATVALLITVFGIFYAGRMFYPKLAKRLDRHNFKNAYVKYAVKNATRVASQSNTVGLVASIATIMIIMLCLLVLCVKTTTHYQTIIKGDYVVIGATANTRERIASLEGCDSVHQAYVASMYVPTYGEFQMIAVDSPEVLTEKYNLDSLPTGNGIYMNDMTFKSWYSDYMEKEMQIEMNKVNKTFILSGTFTASERTLIFNAEDAGVDYNYTIVNVKDGYNMSQFRKEMFAACDSDYIVIMDSEEAMSTLVAAMELYSSSLLIAYIEIIAFAAIGLTDSIVSGLKSRKEEFDCYMAAGMTKNDIKKMKLCECAGVFIFGLLLAAIMLGFVLFLYYELMIGASINVLYLL